MILIINTYAIGDDKVGASVGRVDERGMGKVVHLQFDGEKAKIIKQFVGTLDTGLMDEMVMTTGQVAVGALTRGQQDAYMRALDTDDLTA